MKKIITSIIFIVIIIAFSAMIFDWGRKEAVAPTNENNATTTSDLPIIISYPLEGQEVTSPIKIRGMARGGWYFEASFPIQLNDEAGNIISTAIATALGDWMTTDYVDFTSEMSYPASSTGNATLVFKNDNPSGNPDLDRFELVNVILK